MKAERPPSESTLHAIAKITREQGVNARVECGRWVVEFSPAGVDPAKASGGDDSWEGQFD